RARVLFVDNYDSFVHNLVQHATAAGAHALVVRNDELAVDELERLCEVEGVTHVVVSPGPGTPEDAGTSIDVVRRLGRRTPLLGVCLGHQAIAVAYGARVVRSPRPAHGKPCLVHHDGAGVLTGVEDPLVVGRYHSLVVEESTLPPDLVVTARSPSGLVMGLRHRRHPVEGVQWHPESVLTPAGGDVLARFLRTPAGGAEPG
ncbi:MAG: anthranilate/aminodeoxychorismate synthase component, partial [Marmoricola sp.]|nr:anthranilate/aminodeoxychorismate synthase component [Marmoricola sp.]